MLRERLDLPSAIHLKSHLLMWESCIMRVGGVVPQMPLLKMVRVASACSNVVRWSAMNTSMPCIGEAPDEGEWA